MLSPTSKDRTNSHSTPASYKHLLVREGKKKNHNKNQENNHANANTMKKLLVDNIVMKPLKYVLAGFLSSEGNMEAS